MHAAARFMAPSSRAPKKRCPGAPAGGVVALGQPCPHTPTRGSSIPYSSDRHMYHVPTEHHGAHGAPMRRMRSLVSARPLL
jgi:hypothetical protein